MGWLASAIEPSQAGAQALGSAALENNVQVR